MPSERQVVIIHSSDLHLGADSVFQGSGANLPVLYRVLAVAERENADLVVLAGDVAAEDHEDVLVGLDGESIREIVLKTHDVSSGNVPDIL